MGATALIFAVMYVSGVRKIGEGCVCVCVCVCGCVGVGVGV